MKLIKLGSIFMPLIGEIAPLLSRAIARLHSHPQQRGSSSRLPMI